MCHTSRHAAVISTICSIVGEHGIDILEDNEHELHVMTWMLDDTRKRFNVLPFADVSDIGVDVHLSGGELTVSVVDFNGWDASDVAPPGMHAMATMIRDQLVCSLLVSSQ